ncbi:hypothetical protein ABFX02_14G289400 [Erythranthe guttata]
MLQIHSLFCSHPTTKFNMAKYSHKNSSLRTYENKKTRSRKYIGKSGVNSLYLNSLHDPLGVELPSSAVETSGNSGGGIGITKFFQGKNIFITGATGFLGKALVEKLLRSTSVGKIYVLMKADDKENALDRLSKEIIQSDLFESIREKHGKSYEEFVREKLIPIVGNICEPNLGMDTYSMHAIMDEVDVIIQSAASTAFNDRYDYLIDTNVNAPQRLMRLAKRCKNLKLVVHISTAYVNGKREGLIYENPLVMGENGRKQDHIVDIANEINLSVKSCIAATADSNNSSKALKTLGVERAEFLGWNNTYTLTKAMGEMILNEIREDVPLLIIRPTIIESTYKEPYPGWIQGNRMCDPVIISYGKGLLPAYLADPNVHLDVVPADMVVNTTIAAIAKHGIVINKPRGELNVYHVAADYANPLRMSELFEYVYEHFSANPLTCSTIIKKMKFFNEFDEFSKYVRDEMDVVVRNNAVGFNEKTLQKIEKQYKAKVAYAEELCKIYKFIGFFRARFHSGNTRKLLEEMSEEERDYFEIDVTKIEWRKYFVEIHIPGVRKHLIH